MNKVLLNKNADELKQAMFIVMEPDEVDLHGDITSAEEIRKACFNFNKYCQQPNLFHVSGTDAFDFAESYIAPVEMQIGEQTIKAGTWLATIQVYNDALWDAIKDGEISGLSIGALDVQETIE
jgi:hypothetical protein